MRLAVPAADADGDAVSYLVAWSVDGVPSGAATTTLVAGDTIPASTTALGETWTCSVTAHDGELEGPAGLAAAAVSDVFYDDGDGDGYGVIWTGERATAAPPDSSTVAGDCDDDEPTANPGAVEVCGDALDNDCDGLADLADPDVVGAGTWYLDGDGDGAGSNSTAVVACSAPPGHVAVGGDCDDGDPAVVSGCLVTLLDDADVLIVGSWTDWASGRRVAGAGDVNGDGADDLLVTTNESDGTVYLFHGPIAPGTTYSSAAARLEGEHYNDYAGESLAGVGDIDGDGFDDIVMTAPNHALGYLTYVGRMYLFYGPVTTTDMRLADAIFDGTDASDRLMQTARLGDLDGDGLPDIGVGSYSAGSPTAGLDGRVYLFYGGAFSGTYAAELEADVIVSGTTWQELEYPRSAGDFDGDGVSDLLLGARATPVGYGPGAAYVFPGPIPAGSYDTTQAAAEYLAGAATSSRAIVFEPAGDTDGDGYDDFLVGEPQDDTLEVDAGAAFLVRGAAAPVSGVRADQAAVVFGVSFDQRAPSAATGADLDGDGAAEVIVASSSADGLATNGGCVYLFPGPLAGTWSTEDAPKWFCGGLAYDYAGASVAVAGDLDGDGGPDLAVGASGYATYSGAVALYFAPW